jgi:hypothetical protein
MAIIQDIQQRIDRYFAQKPSTDSYDEIDAAYEAVQALSDEELMQAIHEQDMWSYFLDERIGDTGDYETVRSLLIDSLVAEVLR